MVVAQKVGCDEEKTKQKAAMQIELSKSDRQDQNERTEAEAITGSS